MQIALCDDQPEELALLAGLVDQYLAKRALCARVERFSHPDSLLTALQRTQFSLYLLDIVMPMMDGVALGREIRRLDREAQIVFITTEPQFALQAYAAQPANYLLKPVSQAALDGALDAVLPRLAQSDGQTFAVKTAEGLRVLALSEIVCCEYRSHSVLFTLFTGEVLASRTVTGRFGQYLAPLLADARFLQSHPAFVLNMAQVTAFRRDGFVMRGGAQVPISARLYPAVRDAYMDYLMAPHG